MAKINKVKIYDQWYDIEDGIHFDSNDTLTTKNGHTINWPNYTSGTPPSANAYSPAISVQDKDGVSLAQFRAIYNPNGAVFAHIAALQKNQSGTLRENYLRLSIDQQENKTVDVSDPLPWRKALGADSNGKWPTSLLDNVMSGTVTEWFDIGNTNVITNSAHVRYRVIGEHIVEVRGIPTLKKAITNNDSLGTLPSSVKPSGYNVPVLIIKDGAANTDVYKGIIGSSNGTIYVYASSIAINTTLVIHCIYTI